MILSRLKILKPKNTTLRSRREEEIDANCYTPSPGKWGKGSGTSQLVIEKSCWVKKIPSAMS